MAEGVGIDLYKIEIDLGQEPEKTAEQIYHKLRELPLEIRRKLEMIVEEKPLTQSLQRNYSSMGEEGSD